VVPDSYFDQFSTAKYRNPSRIQRALIRRFVARLHALFVASNPVARVLEIGVGEGFLSGYLSERFPEKHFTGVDLDPERLAGLRRLFPRIETHVGDGYDLGFLPGRYDLVICAEILEHVAEPLRIIDQALARGPRRLLLTVPHEPWFQLSNLARGKNLRLLGNDPEHVQHWGHRSFRAMLEQRCEVLLTTSSYPWLLALAAPREGAAPTVEPVADGPMS
jgi:SAM-dependent methyltransferase